METIIGNKYHELQLNKTSAYQSVWTSTSYLGDLVDIGYQ